MVHHPHVVSVETYVHMSSISCPFPLNYGEFLFHADWTSYAKYSTMWNINLHYYNYCYNYNNFSQTTTAQNYITTTTTNYNNITMWNIVKCATKTECFIVMVNKIYVRALLYSHCTWIAGEFSLRNNGWHMQNNKGVNFLWLHVGQLLNSHKWAYCHLALNKCNVLSILPSCYPQVMEFVKYDTCVVRMKYLMSAHFNVLCVLQMSELIGLPQVMYEWCTNKHLH